MRTGATGTGDGAKIQVVRVRGTGVPPVGFDNIGIRMCYTGWQPVPLRNMGWKPMLLHCLKDNDSGGISLIYALDFTLGRALRNAS